MNAGEGSQVWSNAVLGVAFSLTGAGTAMLGVLLPVLSQRWHMRDDVAGVLFFLQFLGSSLGALLSGSDRRRTLLAAYGILTMTGGALSLAGSHLAFEVFFFWGVGLGMAMTATSLLIADRYGDDRRAVSLERLNFAWSAGAMAAPMFFLPFLRTGNLRPLFFVFQSLFALVFVWVLLQERREKQRPGLPAEVKAAQPAPMTSLLLLVLMAMCAVGVESALNGWMTTYSHRANPGDVNSGVLATALFWLGILLGRLAFSTRLLRVLGRDISLTATLWGAAGSVVLLIASHHGAMIDAAACLAGICIGPVYPLLISLLVERSPYGWIFAFAGMGSALFPWLTGELSVRLGSLRLGLIAPCGAALLMLTLRWAGLRINRLENAPAHSGR